ncbi:hypothetical protein ACT8ZV_11890 [Nocardioides sp. MAHUQ-72]|uniref:hypothetical protein n=1 Tax=unclassified Nocardioides TaxID=2615069 RepID=UPI00360DF392
MKNTAAALLLITVPTLAGAAVLQDPATAGMTTHTKHYVLKETDTHRIGKNDFAGTDKVKSAGTRDVVGFDSITGHFYPKQNRVIIQAAFALKGGIVLVKAHLVGDGPQFTGKILGGTGTYAGIKGSVSGREASHGRTFITFEYVL